MHTIQQAHVLKRDGKTIVPFDVQRIASAVRRAAENRQYVKVPDMDEDKILGFVDTVCDFLGGRWQHQHGPIPIEVIQDAVVYLLISGCYPETAQSYIIYRHMRALARNYGGHRMVLVESSTKPAALRCPGCGAVGAVDPTDARILGWTKGGLVDIQMDVMGPNGLLDCQEDILGMIKKFAESHPDECPYVLRVEIGQRVS